MTLKEQKQANWRAWKEEMYQQWLQQVKKKTVLSHPKRPPRPYDYSKAERYTSGMLYIPKEMMVNSLR